MKLVDFVHVGPGRAGTTWFYNSLKNHSEIAFPRIKETEFFNNNFDKGLTYYQSLFKENGKCYGEVSNMYFADRTALERLYNHNPNVKIIFSVRSVPDLSQSIYKFALRRGIEADFTKFLSMPFGIVMGSGYNKRERNKTLSESDLMLVINALDLKARLRVIREIFPKENIHILNYDLLRRNPRDAYKAMCSFLGVDQEWSDDYSKKVNQSMSPRSKFISRSLTAFATVLRELGMFGLLTFLHQSSLVKRVLFKTKSTTYVDIDENSSELLEKMEIELKNFLNE